MMVVLGYNKGMVLHPCGNHKVIKDAVHKQTINHIIT